jgi:hypothetical protein
LSEEYAVRPFRPGDEEEIVQLLQVGFNGWPRFDLSCSPIDHWRWKYEQNPVRNSIITVAVHNNRVVGVDHSLPLKLKMGERSIICNYAADATVHPDFRGRGISNGVIDLSLEMRRKEGIRFVYFVTRNPIMFKLRSQPYPRFPVTMTNLVRIRDFDEQIRKMHVNRAWLMKMGFHASKLVNNFKNLARGPELSDPEIQISEIPIFDGRIDEFCRKIHEHHYFMVERSRDYLNWRYCDLRAGSFIVRQAVEGGKILGYSVLRINRYRADYPIGYIVDLLTLPDRQDVANALIADATGYFDERNVNIVLSIIVKNHPYEGSFGRYGFLNSRIRLNLFYIILGDAEEIAKLDEVSTGRIHFSYGDIDSLPVDVSH